MSNQRIYIIKAGESEKLVKAANQAQALRHVARTTYTVRTATAVEVAERMVAGLKVEDATAEGSSES